MLPRLRAWLADRIDALAVVLWTVAHKLRPPYTGSLCPDCELGPDVEPCPICDERRLDQQIQNDIFEQGRVSALEALREGPPWE